MIINQSFMNIDFFYICLNFYFFQMMKGKEGREAVL